MAHPPQPFLLSGPEREEKSMTTIEPTLEPTLTFDFRKTQSKNRIRGLWLMMEGFRLPYLGATMALAGAALAKTLTYLLLAYFADSVITQGQYVDGNMDEDLSGHWPGICGSGALRRRLLVHLRTPGGLHRRGNHAPPARLPLRPHPAAELLLPRQHADRRPDRARHLGCGFCPPFLQRAGHRYGPHHPACL